MGIAGLPPWSISSPMSAALPFDNTPAYDEDGRIVVKSTCRKCGESKLETAKQQFRLIESIWRFSL
jgi:hypothetical protein